MLHDNYCCKKSVTQKCCSSQVSTRDEHTLLAEGETPNALVVWSGNEARHGSRNVTLHRLRLSACSRDLSPRIPGLPSVSRAKDVFAHVIHVLNVSHPVLSSRVARTTRRSLNTRTSRMVAKLWLLQVDPRQYGLHVQSTTSAAKMGVKQKPPDQTMLFMVRTNNLVENMISLKHDVAQT